MNKFQFVEKPKSGKRYVIGDIHGCLKTLKKLIEKIQLKDNDQLFFIGDYIDRGPDSKGVLDFIIELNKNPNVFPLLGNHEKNLLQYNNEEFRFLKYHLAKNNELNLLDGKKIHKIYIDFIESLPYYYELDKFFIVHAGIDFNKDDPFKDYLSMLEIRNMPYNTEMAKNKTIVIGHQPTNNDEIINKIKNNQKVLHIDNGIAYRKKHKIYNYTKMGNLVALNLDSYELFFEENQDMAKIDEN